jgi:hypothetical protein
MPTKLTVETRLCGFRTKIQAENGGEVIRFRISSGCPKIRYLAEGFKEIPIAELTDLKGSRFVRMLEEGKLTPTCLVPVALLNAGWIEAGHTSKTLALDKKELTIRFEE